MIPMAWQRLAPMHMLISGHRDGRIIADAVTYFGVESIAGSTRRGGSSALRLMLKQLAAGDCVGITPDGPRGPAMRATSGIVNVARLAGAPIVPVVFATSRRRVLNSWDRFHLPKPFGRGVFLWGEPIEIDRELDDEGLEHARLSVESGMNEMAAEADRRVGHSPMVPTKDLPPLRPAPTLPSPANGGGLGREPSPPSSAEREWSALPALYRGLTAALAPAVLLYLKRRRQRGKEDGARFGERFGIANARRPSGPLVWIHTASVGEATSVLALMQRLVEQRPGIAILATTGTVAAARLLD